MREFLEKVAELLESNKPFVQVTVVDTVGSVPQNSGSKMLVTEDGWYWGTVGGGKVEKRALDEASEMLKNAGSLDSQQKHSVEKFRLVDWNLKKDIGMTCGGSVKFYFELQNIGNWNIVVFGAGHVSNALINLLAKLDCQVTCFDTRQEWLDKLPTSDKVNPILSDDLPKEVAILPSGAFLVLITMGHTTDKPILLEILRGWNKKQYPYIGVIGSKAKAVQLKKDIDEAGLPEELKSLFHCPMGLAIGNNHPQEIAISIVSQLLMVRDEQDS